MEELAFMDATAQADLVRRGEVSALDLVSAAVDRIELLNPRLNAVVTPMFGKACETAALPVNLLPEPIWAFLESPPCTLAFLQIPS